MIRSICGGDRQPRLLGRLRQFRHLRGPIVHWHQYLLLLFLLSAITEEICTALAEWALLNVIGLFPLAYELLSLSFYLVFANELLVD